MTITRILPGAALSLAVTAAACAGEHAERALLGRAPVEALVLAILLGTAVHAVRAPGPRARPGIAAAGKIPLEVAVVLLGASVSAASVARAGLPLLGAIAGVVAVAVGGGTVIGRLLGLPARLALLVACGNGICGNSAIAAVAPVIGATAAEVATAIAFTAVLGVAVVLALPLLGIALGLSAPAYGTFAGLTVYAVPQVIAAAAPLGPAAVQWGTLVKLGRVLMLGPVCVALSLCAPAEAGRRPGLTRLVPPFIVGFLALLAARATGLVPDAAVGPMEGAARLLTILSMAAMGLGVDLRAVTAAGGRVAAAAVISLGGLAALSLAALALLHIR